MSILSSITSTVNSGLASVESVLGINEPSLSGSGLPSAYAQIFRTTPVPVTQYALYRLSIHLPNKTKSALEQFTFPLSPTHVSKRMTSMAAFYDTQASQADMYARNGVTRIIDQYGMSPITFTIEGTTGWQKHLTDGYQYTGLQAIRRVQAMLNRFAALNAVQASAQQDNFYTMEFYDYFAREFYEVVPVGEQEIWQDASQPILSRFRFVLVGTRPVSAPVLPAGSSNDPIVAAFKGTVANVAQNISTFAAGVGDLYSTAASIVSGL